MTHDLAWAAPQPFWKDGSAAVPPAGELRRPRILRFTSDEFVNELLATLERDPASLPGYAVMEETWRGPGTAPALEPRRWLQRTPAALLGVERKTLRRRRADTPAVSPAPSPGGTTTLKLYQPAHLRHYLVGGSLVCRTPGLPDKQIDAARDKVSFVVRRLLPKTPPAADEPLADPAHTELWDEYAFVPTGKTGVWRRVAAADRERDAATLPAGEERLAMFPAFYADDERHRRRLYAGTVPVGRRETYQGAAAEAETGGGGDAMDPRVVLFHTQVLGPWKALVNRVMRNGSPDDDIDDAVALAAARLESVFARSGDGFDPTRPDADNLRVARGGLQTASWYLLLDLYRFLAEHFGPELMEGAATGAAGDLYDALNAAALPTDLTASGTALTDPTALGTLVEPNGAYGADDVELSLMAALGRIAPFEAALESATTTFDFPTPAAGVRPPGGWPDFLFLFADPWFGVVQPPTPPGFAPPPGDYLSEKIQARIDSLADLVKAALPPLAAGQRVAEPTLATMRPADMREAWYVIRLVYERPECAPFETTVVSAATRPFRMASFFDPDAPARPIRIGLPVDTSPAGLRRFDKNAVFMMSDVLCGQIDRMKGLGLADLVLSVLPWPFHKSLSVPEKGDCKTSDGVSLGVMCSLSIPIITICALLLLMIIVSLLDFIFRWLPYFVVCFPLPGFKGRKA
ncbi:MAG TPA: hypothetical protein VGR82_17915 [Methylomirabilota bacterium]|jgi:hypothetical protein|nr:hypothetical protein [Methylomirabilota bacterium]